MQRRLILQIESRRKEGKYLNTVEEIVKPYMDYFCNKLCNTEFKINNEEYILSIFNDI